MPKNTGMGFIIAGACFVLSFALVWHIWWMAALSFLGVVVCLIIRSFDYDTDYYIKAEEVARIESKRLTTY